MSGIKIFGIHYFPHSGYHFRITIPQLIIGFVKLVGFLLHKGMEQDVIKGSRCLAGKYFQKLALPVFRLFFQVYGQKSCSPPVIVKIEIKASVLDELAVLGCLFFYGVQFFS